MPGTQQALANMTSIVDQPAMQTWSIGTHQLMSGSAPLDVMHGQKAGWQLTLRRLLLVLHCHRDCGRGVTSSLSVALMQQQAWWCSICRASTGLACSQTIELELTVQTAVPQHKCFQCMIPGNAGRGCPSADLREGGRRESEAGKHLGTCSARQRCWRNRALQILRHIQQYAGDMM